MLGNAASVNDFFFSKKGTRNTITLTASNNIFIFKEHNNKPNHES